MERLPEFRLARPASYAEAAALLAGEPAARLVAGGTDLVPNLRRGIERPPLLVDLGAVAGRAEMDFDAAGLRLGAGVTLARLAADARIAAGWTALAEAARSAAGPGHRSVATLGGNLCLDTRCVFYNQSEWWRQANGGCLKRGGDTCHVAPQGQRCHAAFSGDLAPALIVLGAEAELLSARGTRRLPLADCYRDDGAAALAFERDEVLTAVRLPPPAPGASGYRKARVRGSMDFPLAGVACALALRDGALAALQLALTGTQSRPLRLAGTEALLGAPFDEGARAALGKLVQKQVSPMRTTATPSNYRRLVAAVQAQRLVAELCAAAQAGA
ncbi:MAG: 4-hydroxybenzoyl-CoA reductase subunit beta [Burkholderiales bacterium]|nr:4-hydroxybenzoyl-CoA reductase subunit beta [Burkholderiales bacterium]